MYADYKCPACDQRFEVEVILREMSDPDNGNWHTYANTYDVFLGDGNVIVTWHGRGEHAPDDDRDLIKWAFTKGREFEREAVAEWTDKHGHLRACEVSDCVRKSLHLPPRQRGNDG